MKIKAISDVITNSSNETYIMYDPSSGIKDLQEIVDTPRYSNNGNEFGRDEFVLCVEKLIGHPLSDNPFPIDRQNLEDTGWGVYVIKPWESSWWTDEELDKMWREFVMSHENDFKKLIGYGLEYGPHDGSMDYDEYQDYCDDLRNQSLMYAPRDCSIWDENV